MSLRSDSIAPRENTMPLDRAAIDPVFTEHHERGFEHVMIDIETMSLSKHNALILSVGMLEFDPEPLAEPKFGASQCITFDIPEQLLLGREISVSTQKFWMAQPSEASDHWRHPQSGPFDCRYVLGIVRKFCTTNGKPRVWANGTQFDLANLEGLADQIKLGAELWHYQSPRDMRTFCRETKPTRLIPLNRPPSPGAEHDPLYDCYEQAWKIWAHWTPRP